MKKSLISIILFTVIFSLLCGCNVTDAENNHRVREISSYSNLCNNGELYLDYDKEAFFDFTSMTGTYICAKPNCSHSNPKDCSAYGMSELPFIYKDKIYYFVSDIVANDDGSFSDRTDFYKADMDGTNREIVDTIKDFSIENIKMFLIGDELYLSAVKHSFSEYGGYGSDQAAEKYFCKYNLSDNSLTEIKNFGAKYSCSLNIYGVFNNAVYFYLSYSEKPISIDDNDTVFVTEQYKYELDSGTLSDCDIQGLVSISEGWAIIDNDSDFTLINENNEKAVIDGNYRDYDYIVNNIIFSGYYGYCVNLENGKKYALNLPRENSENQGIRYIVKDFIEERYIVQVLNYTENSKSYISLTEDELIGEKIG